MPSDAEIDQLTETIDYTIEAWQSTSYSMNYSNLSTREVYYEIKGQSQLESPLQSKWRPQYIN